MKNKLGSIYPLTKLLFVVLVIITSMFFSWQYGYLIILPFCLILSAINNSFFSYLKKVLLILLILLTFIFLFKVLIDDTNTRVMFVLFGKNITLNAVIETLKQTKVLVSIVSGFVLFFETTELEDMMIAMEQSNIPNIVGYIFLSSIQMISDMGEKSKVILESQKARGIETDGNVFTRMKAFFPTLGPLIISSITDLEDKAITLEVRGFSYPCKKTSYKDIRIKKIDKIINICMLVIAAILILIRVILW